jgi:hypothetical protein
VDVIRRVKVDTVAPELQREFYERTRRPTSPDVWTKSD